MTKNKSKNSSYILVVKVCGMLPPFSEVAYAIWGDDVDFDSDGDSINPDSTTWRELSIILRPDYEERLDIDPISDDKDTIKIVATSQQVLDAAYKFLYEYGSIECVTKHGLGKTRCAKMIKK